MVPRGTGPAPVRRFFLARRPAAGTPPELAPAETEHALRVLRIGAGDRLIGLDGTGGAWPIEVRAATRRALELVLDGEPVFEPRPGELGARVPWIELAIALPRAARAEAMLDRLTQLGLAVLQPLATQRASPEARRGEARAERLERIAIEACKQSGRTWLPRIEVERSPEALLAEAARKPGATLLVLDPSAAERLSDAIAPLRARGVEAASTARPLVLVVGPEGGFSDEETARFAACGARAVRLHPHVLRIETAAEAALAIVAEALAR